MTEKELRKKAAELTKDLRTIKKVGTWRIREWNDKIRFTVRSYMNNTRHFAKIHGTWEGK